MVILYHTEHQVQLVKTKPLEEYLKVKKMSGHMGDVRRTIQNLEVIEIDEERNLLFVKGSVSGHVNSDLIVTPAIKSKKIDREIFVTLDQSSEAQQETPETSSEAQQETPETSSEAQQETPETSSEAQQETPETSSEAQQETPETSSEAQQETPETSSEAQQETPETSSGVTEDKSDQEKSTDDEANVDKV